ncbi:MAG: hypothetical protein LBU42_04360 [Prevotellaceae bacterium]|jgi:uncharacterized membrane protein|nr:hypothetical protein [Prevotellaceae bacterium]
MKFFEKKGNVFGLAMAVWLLLSAVTEILLRRVIPQYDFVECRYIPALFLVFLLIFAGLVWRWEKKLQEGSVTPAHVSNYFLMWKMGKLVIALLLFFFCYLWLDASIFRAFLFLFLLFYLVFMGLEIFVLRSIERRYKRPQTDKK